MESRTSRSMKNIDPSFIQSKLRLNWSEALWGYENLFVKREFLVQLALDRLDEGSTNPLEIELAGLLKEELAEVDDIVSKLAKTEGASSAEVTKMKWLYINLSWAYEQRNTYEDPLAIVEDIYADFDYPPEVAEFVRYMPVNEDYEPLKHSKEENEQRLLSLWNKFINTKWDFLNS